jgi:hypothetical protein
VGVVEVQVVVATVVMAAMMIALAMVALVEMAGELPVTQHLCHTMLTQPGLAMAGLGEQGLGGPNQMWIGPRHSSQLMEMMIIQAGPEGGLVVGIPSN